MPEQTSTHDLQDRLAMIETMINEGRRSTESWGWTFLLWGIAYLVAMGWASLGGSPSVWGHQSAHLGGAWTGLAWPVTMISTCLLTMAIGLHKGKGKPATAAGRAIVSIWMAVGISMLLIFPSLAISGRLDQHAFVALVGAMLGVANGASALILRWKMQLVCAAVWWITSAVACFGSDAQLTAVFVVAIFVCQIVFGTYAMFLESRRHAHRGAVHA